MDVRHLQIVRFFRRNEKEKEKGPRKKIRAEAELPTLPAALQIPSAQQFSSFRTGSTFFFVSKFAEKVNIRKSR